MRAKKLPSSLGGVIDELGSIRDSKKQLETREKQLVTSLKNMELQLGTYLSEQYQLTVDERITREFDKDALFEELGQKDFIACVKVVVEEIEKRIPAVRIDRFIRKLTSSTYFRVEKK